MNGSIDRFDRDSAYLAQWSDVVAPLIQAVNTDEFGNVFFESINRFVPIDSALIMLFQENQEPIVLFDRLHPAEEASFYDVYLGGAYLLSPLYRRFTSLRSGFYRLGSIEDKSFSQSDFGIAYFNQSGLCDDANFVHKIDDSTALVASFGRQQLGTPFTNLELRQLHVAEPVFRSALAKQWGGSDLSMLKGAEVPKRAHGQLKSSLEHFGSSILTEREKTVLGLMLEGKPSKASAKKMGISSETERGHRKNIYAKLDVASQAQLFSLIFRVLSEVDLEDANDPYAAYLELGSVD